ncbi:MAG: DUF1826 domain-containing protein [Candidatus Azotimanducaceae bacterium]|uniref:DUF1826 domain-containing protein n=1 Tax=OM182 bacterium TaxID=2510334 RepID=A0A520S021_9GAMM|nr:hypothetical protein [Gammaproteobacteria bacterium]RZO75818.1 MAG: DUF1826 domain-containing protein [OM182 bacterium]
MQHVISNRISDFKKIYRKNVELVSISHSTSDHLTRLAGRLFSSHKTLELKWRQKATDKDSPTRELRVSIEDNEAIGSLTKEIVRTNEILYELFDCKEISIRVTTLSKPMCPKFHVDAIACRMLTTISGGGTEWISRDDVDESVLANRWLDTAPLKTGKEIRQLKTSAMSLLKGGSWQEGFEGVVHRSPHQSSERLLLSYDPIFSD